MSALTYKNEPVLTFATVSDLEAYMAGEPRHAKGFWLRLAKAGAPVATVGKESALEAALCCGWIDGQLGKLDEHYFVVRMTPRRSGSRWSVKNRTTAERLAQEGRLNPAGQAEIDTAKADGRWDAAYASQANATLPQDLAAALALNPVARDCFAALDSANRFAIIYRVNDAKKPETRARRIEQFVQMLARGEALHPRRKTGKSGAS
ncbi:YdeI/OmpD-associated family protein [Silvimonas amylolytica]|uniref:Bacteriocin-protection, YdeI or OmpD-Associated n=1 Tax=Silvimonas amylolytica TaxID=449663 RepID=A0ABQ2PM40_9NEIS|nr:YdeI/OmpD-associated family protein [Silvimonas amylolytica]GGP26077.1 hypothetical protein GCM10010971_18960 [Silvimonas amylolytica]